MKRIDAVTLLEEMIQNQNLRRHGLAVEAIMAALCKYLRDRYSQTNMSSLGSTRGSSLNKADPPISRASNSVFKLEDDNGRLRMTWSEMWQRYSSTKSQSLIVAHGEVRR